MVTRLDDYVGRVLDRLREDGQADNTIVVFTSDNGPHKEGGHDPAFFQSWGPLRGFKRDLTEGGIREPTIIRWPGHVLKGHRVPQIAGAIDLLPTLADFAGIKIVSDKQLDGKSLKPLLTGSSASWARASGLFAPLI